MSKTKKIKLPKMDDIYQQIAEERLTKGEAVKRNAKALFDYLENNTRITSIEATFDGCGDSGQINAVNYYDHRDKDVAAPLDNIQGSRLEAGYHWNEKKKKMEELPAREGCVEELVHEICYDKLGSKHMGWEINEGSYGTFSFDVLNRKISLEFNERVESVNTTEEIF
jgi:hypothetical protein